MTNSPKRHAPGLRTLVRPAPILFAARPRLGPPRDVAIASLDQLPPTSPDSPRADHCPLQVHPPHSSIYVPPMFTNLNFFP
jgi:hypothetical protein